MAETSILTVKGQKQSLSDALVLLQPGETPMLSLCKKGKAPIATLYQWPIDKLADPSTAGVLANADVSSYSDEHANRELLGGRVQKVRRAFMVDDFTENVAELAGIGKKQAFAKAAAKALLETKLDIESILGSDNDSVLQNGSNPNKTRGIGSWIASSAQADTATAVPAAYLTPAASINTTATASLTETNVTDVLASIWGVVKKVKNYDLICGTALKRAFSNFTRTATGSTNVMSSVRTFTQDAESKKICNVIDIYESDFGTLSLHLDAYLANGSAAAVVAARGYVLDMDLVELSFNRQPRMETLPDLGGGPRGFVDAILGSSVLNPAALGKFAATT